MQVIERESNSYRKRLKSRVSETLKCPRNQHTYVTHDQLKDNKI